MLMTTTDSIQGQRVVRVFGLVKGESVRARHVGADIMALLRNLVGGEIKGYSRLLAGSREEALERLAKQAEALGANAIVGIRFGSAMIMSGAAEILVYGTAVRVEAEQPR